MKTILPSISIRGLSIFILVIYLALVVFSLIIGFSFGGILWIYLIIVALPWYEIIERNSRDWITSDSHIIERISINC